MHSLWHRCHIPDAGKAKVCVQQDWSLGGTRDVQTFKSWNKF